jgi:hypothetical protein
MHQGALRIEEGDASLLSSSGSHAGLALARHARSGTGGRRRGATTPGSSFAVRLAAGVSDAVPRAVLAGDLREIEMRIPPKVTGGPAESCKVITRVENDPSAGAERRRAEMGSRHGEASPCLGHHLPSSGRVAGGRVWMAATAHWGWRRPAEVPLRVMRWAPWTSRSRTASARRPGGEVVLRDPSATPSSDPPDTPLPLGKIIVPKLGNFKMPLTVGFWITLCPWSNGGWEPTAGLLRGPAMIPALPWTGRCPARGRWVRTPAHVQAMTEPY